MELEVRRDHSSELSDKRSSETDFLRKNHEDRDQDRRSISSRLWFGRRKESTRATTELRKIKQDVRQHKAQIKQRRNKLSRLRFNRPKGLRGRDRETMQLVQIDSARLAIINRQELEKVENSFVNIRKTILSLQARVEDANQQFGAAEAYQNSLAELKKDSGVDRTVQHPLEQQFRLVDNSIKYWEQTIAATEKKRDLAERLQKSVLDTKGHVGYEARVIAVAADKKAIEAKLSHERERLVEARAYKASLEREKQSGIAKTSETHPEAQGKTPISANGEVSQALETQLEMAQHSTEYLRTRYDQAKQDLQSSEKKRDETREKAQNIYKRVWIALAGELEMQTSAAHEDAINVKKEIHENNQDKGLDAVDTLKKKNDILEDLVPNLDKIKPTYLSNAREMRRQQRDYADALDEQREHVRQQKAALEKLSQKLGGSTQEGSKRNSRRRLIRRRLKEGDAEKHVERRSTKGDAKERVDDLLRVARRQEDILTREIRDVHERTKDIDGKLGVMKHPYFLSEHMIDESEIPEEVRASEADRVIFASTPESVCVPTAIRMIHSGEDSSVKDKALEVAQMLESYSAAGTAPLKDIPGVLKKLGHSVPYEAVEIRSMYDLLKKVEIDKQEKVAPCMIGICRRDLVTAPGHVLVCDRIVDIKGKKCAVLRDSIVDKRYAVRLDHMDEVLMRSAYGMPKDQFDDWLKNLPEKSYNEYLKRLSKPLVDALNDGNYDKYFWPNVVIPVKTKK